MITVRSIKTQLETTIISKLERMPIISIYSKTRGWPFIISWCHRLSGLILVAFIWFHIYTLSSLTTPANFEAKMELFSFFIFACLQWALAIPVIFHAFNGGRLILYESFEIRNDESMIRWMLGLSVLYAGLLGALMLIGSQSVSAVFFWLITLVAGLTLAYGVSSKVWATQHSLMWMLQRISGAYLLVLISAHMLFMHLNYPIGHDVNIVVMRMQNYFIKGVDISLVVGLLYHAGYGLVTVIGDYIGSRTFRIGLAVVVFLVMLVFALVGIKLALLI